MIRYWWVTSNRPGLSFPLSADSSIIAAFLTGVAAIILMLLGINTLTHDSTSTSILTIVLITTVSFFITLFISGIMFHRPATSELFIIHLWLALELSVISVLYGSGRFSMVQTGVLSVLVLLASVVGLICYVLYYRYDEIGRLLVGSIPLATDAVLMVIMLIMLAIS